jgi:uncharacterized membrane protein YccC
MNRYTGLLGLAAAMRQEIAGAGLHGERAARAARTVASVALAVIASHYLALSDSWWVAITAFTVMQTDFASSIERALHRVFGTACGAGLGAVAAPWVSDKPVALVLLLAMSAWAGLLASLVLKHSYAWVLATVTFLMVAMEAFHDLAGVHAFAAARVLDIVIGSAACLLVAGAWHAGTHKSWRLFAGGATDAAAPAPALPPPRIRPAVLHALNGGLCVGLLAAVSCIADLRYFPQAMVTAIAVLVVPLGTMADDADKAVSQKMMQRLAGCLCAGIAALLLLPLIDGRPWLCQGVLGLGVWAGAYLQSGAPAVRYLGTQFAVAFIMVMVQDKGWIVSYMTALERLGGVAAGVAALCLIVWTVKRIKPRSARRA